MNGHEAAVRELLIMECRRLLAEYQARQNRPWYGQPHQWFDFSYIEDAEFSKEWPDYASLAGAMSYIYGFADSMNHGFSRFDSRTWEEAVNELKKITARLEAGNTGR